MEQEYAAQTPLDEMVSCENAQLLKATLPYMPPKAQKVLSLYLKTKELQHTAALFSSSGHEAPLQAAELPPDDPMEIFQDLRRYCRPKNRQKMDELCNLFAMMQMFQIMNEDSCEKGVSI